MGGRNENSGLVGYLDKHLESGPLQQPGQPFHLDRGGPCYVKPKKKVNSQWCLFNAALVHLHVGHRLLLLTNT